MVESVIGRVTRPIRLEAGFFLVGAHASGTEPAWFCPFFQADSVQIFSRFSEKEANDMPVIFFLIDAFSRMLKLSRTDRFI